MKLFVSLPVMKFKDYLPFYKRNAKVAIPIMVTQAGQYIVQLADNIMVGHLGTAELAGVAFANSLLVLANVFSIGFAQGLTPHVGQYYGEGRFSMAANYFKCSILINTILSFILCAVMFLPYAMLDYMGQDPEILVHTRHYYSIGVFGMIPFIFFYTIRQFSEGIGITKYAMYITLGANLMNIFLNWVLIYGKLGAPQMGVAGAATATLISRIVMCIWFVWILFSVYPYKHYFKFMRGLLPAGKTIRSILSTSIPLSVQNLFEIVAFSLSAIMIGWIGKETLAGHQIAMSMSSMSFMVAIGFGAAATIRVSHQYGEKDYKATQMAGIASVHLSIGFMISFGVIFIILRRWIPFVFTNDPAVQQIASTLLIMVALYQAFDALQLAALASLRALKDVKIPLILSTISYFFICLPTGYLMGFVFNLGAIGVWIGLATGLLIAGVTFYIRFIKITNRIIRNNG